MIYKKEKSLNEYEAGSKYLLLQSYDDTPKGSMVHTKNTENTKKGSEAEHQIEILVDAYNTFGINGHHSKSELAMIEGLDNIFDKVDVVAAHNKGKDRLNFAVETGEQISLPYSVRGVEYRTDGAEQERILGKAYGEYTQDGKLTKKEIAILEKIDDVLAGADIVINPITGDATIASQQGFSNLPFPKGNGR